MILIPIFALLIGAMLAKLIGMGPTQNWVGTYLAVACVAGLDSVVGGIRSGLEGKFSTDVFITGFISNIGIAFFMAWLGDRIGTNLLLAAVLIMGTRIFTNLSLIRRFVLTKIADDRERRRLQEQQRQSQQQAQPSKS